MSESGRKNPTIPIIIAVVALSAAGLIVYRSQGGPKVAPPTQAYFYSLQTGDLFTAPYDSIPPVPNPAGGEGVRAYVFSCGECTPASQFIAYLETYPPEAKTRLEAARAAKKHNDAALVMTERQVAAPPASKGDAPAWITAATAQGERLTTQHRTKCGDAGTLTCEPRK